MEFLLITILMFPCSLMSFLLYKIWRMNSNMHWQTRFHNDQNKFANMLKRNDMSLQYLATKKEMIICLEIPTRGCATFGIRRAMLMIIALQNKEMEVSSFKDLILAKKGEEENRRSTKEQFLDRIF